MAEKLKLALAALVVIAALTGFYYYGDQSLLLRVVGLLVAAGVSLAIVMQTDVGRNAWAFVKESQVEIRKVVWPTRKETIQTTLVVMAMAVFIALLLWGIDAVLVWAIKWLTGQGD